MDNNKFFCYSNRLHSFLLSMKFQYVSTGVNKNTNKDYWVYAKSEKLDEAIIMYNLIKHKYN